MESLGSSPLFNIGGMATLASFFGINVANVTQWANINLGISIGIGVISLIYLTLKVYLTWLQLKKIKKIEKVKQERSKDY